MTMKSSPILVLGIGGTGLKVATYVLKGMMEANNNVIPSGFATLVADTESQIKFQAGGWGQARGKHHATGPVAIGQGDYIPLTGNIKKLGEGIRDEQRAAAADPSLRRRQARHHISNWFQAHHYIHEAVVDEAVWNLDVGAGQYPQFGRLGFFNHVNGHVKTLLTGAIQNIKKSGNNFQVHIIGSFAGGTGAGLYVDFPHLIREIAKQAGFNQSPTIIGHFALSEAFRGTQKVDLANDGTKQAFDSRTYAALRQLTRLQGQSLPNAGGYPLVYDPNGTGILNKKLEKSPYTYSYLYDGQRERNELNSLEIEDGLAPSIADVVLAYADGRSGPAFQSHTVNYKAYYNSHNIPSGQVTYGSVGTYTIELPIFHITEGWSHQLAQEMLDIILSPQINETTGEIILINNLPGGKESDPGLGAQTWIKEGGVTSLLRRLMQWGKETKTTSEKTNTIQEILSNDAEAWLKDLAPTDAGIASYVAEAQDDLQGSFKDKQNRYFVDYDQGGSNNEARAANLIEEIARQMRAMVGSRDGVWLRAGGNFYHSLAPLANFHRKIFEDALLSKLDKILNGSGGSSREKKQGKLGYARDWVRALEADIQATEAILSAAAADAARGRSEQFQTLNREFGDRQNDMRHRSGVLGRNLRAYRDKANDLAQFHKADIARKVIHDLVKRLAKSLYELGNELEHWIRSLATTTSAYGNAYNLLQDGFRDIEQDRQRSKNAARWVIDNTDRQEISSGEYQEIPNPYIEGKQKQYRKNSLDDLLDNVTWRVEQTAEGEFRVQFATHGQDWDRRAGKRGEKAAGQKNLDYVLRRCRTVFEPAWEDMSVTEYLYANYNDKENALAQKVYKNSGYLLGLNNLNAPPMRSTYMRVFKESMEHAQSTFLDKMLTQIRVLFNDSTSAQQREAAAKAAQGEYNSGLLNADGQDSYDRFKLTYIMFGDLLQPHQIAGYVNAQQPYRAYSRAGKKWKTLQILPAETNALAIERDMDNSQNRGAGEQRRRELNEEVVAVLEDMDRFRLAMRCLAYGEEAFPWQSGDRGLLLHQYTPRENNRAGHSYWRLTVAGHRLSARPTHYQLSEPANNPDLWEAVLQLVVVRKGKGAGNTIDLERVEKTIAQAQTTHQSRLQQIDKLTWKPKKEFLLDTQFKEEGLDKAAQVVRLSNLIAEIDQKLENGEREYAGDEGKEEIKWKWVWKKQTEGAQIAAPEKMDEDTKKKVIRNVDLYTAIRWAANDEFRSLSSRLYQLGQWPDDKVPNEKIHLYDLPKGWICSNGHHNNASRNFCTECGDPREQPQQHPDPIPEPPRDNKEIQKQLDALKVALDLGAITQEQHDKQFAILQKTAVDSATQEKLDALKMALDLEAITQEQYDKQVAVLQGTSTDPEKPKKLKALKTALELGALTQEQYDVQVDQLHNSQ